LAYKSRRKESTDEGRKEKRRGKTEEQKRKKVSTGRIKKKQRETRRRTGQHRETVTEEQRNRSKRNPTAISIHRCCPLTCRTRGKEIRKKRNQSKGRNTERKSRRTKGTQETKTRIVIIFSFLETRCVRFRYSFICK
jgi:hypothetical protein